MTTTLSNESIVKCCFVSLPNQLAMDIIEPEAVVVDSESISSGSCLYSLPMQAHNPIRWRSPQKKKESVGFG